MSQTRRKFTREFKVAAVKRLQSGYPVGRVARELEVNPSQLQLWKREFQERPNSTFSGECRKRGKEAQVAELELKIGQQTMELDCSKGACERSRSCGCRRQKQPIRSLPEDPARTGKGAAR